MKNKKSYWDMYHVEHCPVCGDSDVWKERIYDKPKPEKKEDRIKHSYLNCYCYLW